MIEPGQTIGILGGGQLGRMTAAAALRMGYRVHVLAPEQEGPAKSVCDQYVSADYSDREQIMRFARQVDVMTVEFENIPIETLEWASQHSPVRPQPDVVGIAQNRVREKTFLRDAGIAVPEFAIANGPDELEEIFDRIGFPSVMKSTAWGYDGKGQTTVHDLASSVKAWQELELEQAIVEQFIDYVCEISVIVARTDHGRHEVFGPFRNRHRNHILDVSSFPSGLSPITCREAEEIGIAIAEKLDLRGMICVEMFHGKEGSLLVNEIAPRPHNSGHLTMEGFAVSQFEQHVRAICNAPLAKQKPRQPTVMVNLLGDLWEAGPPPWEDVLSLPGVALHLYGKQEPRPRRKMGHLNVAADTIEEAMRTARHAFSLLERQPVSR